MDCCSRTGRSIRMSWGMDSQPPRAAEPRSPCQVPGMETLHAAANDVGFVGVTFHFATSIDLALKVVDGLVLRDLKVKLLHLHLVFLFLLLDLKRWLLYLNLLTQLLCLLLFLLAFGLFHLLRCCLGLTSLCVAIGLLLRFSLFLSKSQAPKR